MADIRNPPADIERTGSFEAAVYDEKVDVANSVGYDGGSEELIKIVEVKGDPFPIDPSVPEEEHQLTVRAILVGCALGAVVGASNIYLGLKTG